MIDSTTSEVKDHAEFGASNAHRWLSCPGSIELSKKAPPQRESPYAAEGTEAHACFEFLLKNRTKLSQAVKIASKKYNADMVEHASNAVAWVVSRAKLIGGGDILSEQKVDSSAFTCTGQFGTLDAAIVQEFGKLVVIDYKYGAGVAVDPEGEDGEGNPQLVYYALALSHQYHHNFTDVELVVIQPRAWHESGDSIRTVTLPIDKLLAWAPRFRDGVMATGDDKAPLAAGSWCKFCPATPICPELKERAMKAAQIVFSDAKGIEVLPEPKSFAIPNLGRILDACDKLETWIEKVRDHATHVLESGGSVSGYKLVEKRSTRKWTDESRASVVARKLFGDRAFTEPELLSPAQLEKTGKTSIMDEFIAAHTTSKSTGTTLVKDSDKRPAVNPIASVFSAVAVTNGGDTKRLKEKRE